MENKSFTVNLIFYLLEAPEFGILLTGAETDMQFIYWSRSRLVIYLLEPLQVGNFFTGAAADW